MLRQAFHPLIRFFCPPERQPLLPHRSTINEVIVQTDVKQKNNKKIAPMIPALYDEILFAIRILKMAKDKRDELIKASLPYKEKERKQRNFCGAWNAACVLLVPGASIGLTLKIHSAFSEFTSKRMDTLLKVSSNALGKLTSFTNWYNSEMTQLDQEIKPYKDPMINTREPNEWLTIPAVFPNSYEHPYSHPCYDQLPYSHSFIASKELSLNWDAEFCRVNYHVMENQHFSKPIVDYCKTTIGYSISRCIDDYFNGYLEPRLPVLCEMETELLKCMDQYAALLPEQQKIKAQFETKNLPIMANLQTYYDQTQADVNYLNNKITLASAAAYSVCAVSGTLSAAYAFYLYFSWKNAVKEYETYLQGKAGYGEYLSNSEFEFVNNLTKKLNISMEEMTIEKAIKKLEKLIEPQREKACSISFFIAASAYGVPSEPINNILEKANLPSLEECELDDARRIKLANITPTFILNAGSRKF